MNKKSKLTAVLIATLAFLAGLFIGQFPNERDRFQSAPTLSGAEERRKVLNISPTSLSDSEVIPSLLLLLKDPDHLVRVAAISYLVKRNGTEIPRYKGVNGNLAIEGMGGRGEAWDAYADILYNWLWEKHTHAL